MCQWRSTFTRQHLSPLGEIEGRNCGRRPIDRRLVVVCDHSRPTLPRPLSRSLSSRGSALGAPRHGLHEARRGARPRVRGSCHRPGGRCGACVYFSLLTLINLVDDRQLVFLGSLRPSSRIAALGAYTRHGLVIARVLNTKKHFFFSSVTCVKKEKRDKLAEHGAKKGALIYCCHCVNKKAHSVTAP